MSEAQALAAIGRASHNVALIQRHGRRRLMAVLCIVRLADLEQMAGALGPESAELACEGFRERLHGLLRDADEMIALSTRKWALVLKGITSEDHVVLAIARLERLLAEPVIIFDEPVMLRVNLGYRVIDGHEASAEALFWGAEQSLEAAKRAGLTARTTQDTAVEPAARGWLLEAELRQALDDGEFHLYFQPKIDARFHRVIGAEALVRWHSRKHGVVAPGAFIETIERSDLAGPFTHFIFKHALALASNWPGELSVAVNLPPSALADAALPHTIRDALAIFDVAPERLEIEITEGTLMLDPALSRRRLEALRTLGIRISIDDFGTGQSSLAQLRSLPVDHLKIDRSFVADVVAQPELVKYVIDLARALRLTVIAEGVEDEAQAAVLTELGADLLQGYWISRPIDQQTFVAWLNQRGVT